MRILKTTGLPIFCLLAVMIAAPVFAADGDVAPEKAAVMSKEDQKKYDLALEKALVHYEKAQLLHEKKDMQKAGKELEAIISLEYPEAAAGSEGVFMQLDMHAFLGEIYLEEGKNKEAVEILKKGIAKAPEISTQAYQLYMTLGHAYKEMKKVDEALEAFEKAEKINEELRKREKKAPAGQAKEAEKTD